MSETALNHDDVIERLPMLLAGSLPDAEVRAVREHLSGCLVCRREQKREAIIHDAIKADSAAADVPQSDAARVLGRIDDYEERRRRNPLAAFVRYGREHPLFVLAAHAALILLVVFVVVSPVDREPPGFTTLSEPDALPAGQYVRVVFDTSLDRNTVTAITSSMNMTIVDGPGERGIYTLAAEPGATDYGSIADVLRERDDVLFAEAIRIGAAR